MIVVGCCAGGSGEKFDEIARPWLDAILEPNDRIVVRTGAPGICAAYNSILAEARSIADCEAVVLIHDDVEVRDPHARWKFLAAAAESGVGAAGVAGGAGFTTNAWWEARRRCGRVLDSNGAMDFGPVRGEVEAVDGLMLILAPAAFTTVDFDSESFPGFHGYDVDYCLSVLSRGLRVVVRPIDVYHRTKEGYGDEAAFDAAGAELANKWPGTFIPRSARERVESYLGQQRHKWAPVVKGRIKAALRGERMPRRSVVAPGATSRVRSVPSPEVVASATVRACPCCESPFPKPATSAPVQLLECPTCGTIAIEPGPARDLASDGLFVERYGDTRLGQRGQWFREADLRVQWVQLYRPDGILVEVGAATGEFTLRAQAAGYEAYAVEISEWAAAEASRLSIPPVAPTLQQWRERHGGGRCDVVAMWHVLEHVPDPAQLLAECRTTLREGGVLALEVPSGDSEARREQGIAWDATQPADHHYLFSLPGLSSLVRAAGFSIVALMPMTRRVYLSDRGWRVEKAEALRLGRTFPTLDFIRLIAVRE